MKKINEDEKMILFLGVSPMSSPMSFAYGNCEEEEERSGGSARVSLLPLPANLLNARQASLPKTLLIGTPKTTLKLMGASSFKSLRNP